MNNSTNQGIVYAECNSACTGQSYLVITPVMMNDYSMRVLTQNVYATSNLVLAEFIEYVDYQVLLDLCEENTILSTGAQVETGFQVSIEDPIVWTPAIYNYAIACDIFPQMSEILDLPYLLRCYDTCEVPKAEKAMFIPELY